MQVTSSRRFRRAAKAALAGLLFGAAMLLPLPASASAATCAGKPARTISRSGSVTVGWRENVLLTGRRVSVFAKGSNRICSTTGDIKLRFRKSSRNVAFLGSGDDSVLISAKASVNSIDLGDGNNTIRVKAKSNTLSIRSGRGNDRVVLAAKATRQSVSTGRGDDVVIVAKPARTNHRVLKTGLGNDRVRIRARGHTTAFLSEQRNPSGLSDTDTYFGGPSNDTVFDYHGGTDRKPNLIRGYAGFDKLHSLGNARSDTWGGDGTDWIYAASSGGSGDRIFGERGNDKLFADRGGNDAQGAFLDGGEGDDWVYGTAGGDTIMALSGIKKIYGKGGDDTVIKSGNGIGKIVGGGGYDTISYAAHTPPGYGNYSGVMVNLGQSRGSNGKGVDTISSIEHLIGSPFDDLLTGGGAGNRIDGGMGNDKITAYSGERVDGGLGVNECSGGEQTRCNQYSPGAPGSGSPVLDIGPEGILTVIGGRYADRIEVGYDAKGKAYLVDLNRTPALSRDCESTQTSGRYRCPTMAPVLSTATVEAGGGNDRITVKASVPRAVNMVLNGGRGFDTVTGGPTKDFVQESERVNTGGGNDLIYQVPGGRVNGGKGSDTIHVQQPCGGGYVAGGSGRSKAYDSVVFAGAAKGVRASLKTLRARWKRGSCKSPVRLSRDLDGLEGSKHADVLEAGGRKESKLFGRDGADVFKARNGIRDKILTGGGGKSNRVDADRFDKITWGWGLAAY